MIPSGYKEDTVYSQIPTDGSGDLSFTRASNGTRINSAGLVEVTPWNLLEQSETFDNGVWAKESGNSVTANTTTAPNGTTTADTLSATATNTINTYQVYAITAGVYTYSVYVKKKSTNIISTYIYQTGVGFAAIGEINFDNETFTNGTIESVGDGWFRVALSATLTTQTHTFGFYTSSTTGTRDVYIWGAQLNIGSTAKPYFPTTDRLNVPRLTYQNGGGGCPSLLLEKQSTNLVSWSDDFSNSDWGKYQCSVSTNQTTSPDGTQNADKLTLSGNSGTYTGLVYRTTTPGANSIYMKNDSIGNGKFYIQVDGIGNASWNSNGTLSSVSGGTATNGENIGNGWFRFTYVCSGGAYINYGIADATTGDSIYVWGAQVEAGSYATSIINTTSSSATRVADACFKTGISSLIGQSQGTIFVDSVLTHSTTNNEYLIQVSASASNRFFIYREALSNKLGCFALIGSTQIYTQLTSGAITGRVKAAFAYQSGSFAFYVNGTQIGVSTATFSTPPTMDRLDIDSNAGLENGYYNYNEAIIFPTRLTNAELQALTTL
jgi:hypothetical protein